MSRAIFASILGLALMLTGCPDAGPEGGGGAATTTTSATTDDPCAACVAPQICGVGCGEVLGCYTPGGTLDAGPNDCPSCFPMFDRNNEACGDPATVPPTGAPYAFFCQPNATPLGGCTASTSMAGYECCPPGPDGGAP